jgi:hypothetical protein
MARKVTNEEIEKYIPMIESYIRKDVLKNWREASLSKNRQETTLGNTGWTVRDIRQYLMSEVFIALTKFNPTYITPEGRTVKESSFVFGHIMKRGGSLCKRLTKKRLAYGVWSTQLEKALKEFHDNEI